MSDAERWNPVLAAIHAAADRIGVRVDAQIIGGNLMVVTTAEGAKREHFNREMQAIARKTGIYGRPIRLNGPDESSN